MRRFFKVTGCYGLTTKPAFGQQFGLIQRISDCMSGFLAGLAGTHELFQFRSDLRVWCADDAE